MSDNEKVFECMVDDPILRVELALEDIRAGKMVILIDDEDRENEGDLVVAAEKITAEGVNFMATHARGLICLTLTSQQVERLHLPMMASNNQSAYNTAFTVSIEAREGVTTGISAADRAHTTLVAIDPASTAREIVTPGHVFPLRARDGGVLERVGQTEGSVDLARMAGLNPSGVICEIMNADGTMARLPELRVFGQEHKIRIVAVADMIRYRMRKERVVVGESEGDMELDGLGTWHTRLYRGLTGGLHMALWKGTLTTEPTLVRVQSAPPSWAFVDARSPTAVSARRALKAVNHEGGVVVFMHLTPGEESLRRAFKRDIEGAAAEEPAQLHADALRDLGTGCQILVDLGLRDIKLLSSSHRSILGVEAYGLNICERVPLS